MRRVWWYRACGELLLVVILFLGYRAGRLIVVGRSADALANGEGVWRFERLMRLPDEAAIQLAVLEHDTLVTLINSYYAYVHFPATAACLVWLYVKHPVRYRETRWMLTALTAAALVLHILVPLAPPRLTALTGLVDTGALYGPGVYGPPEIDTSSNQYAAMPSLHVGWAVVVALALMALSRSRWRALWLLHPAVTLYVVVATGNHYGLDAIAAVAILTVVIIVMQRFSRSPIAMPRLRGASPAVLPAPSLVRDGPSPVRM